jgi:HK97 gp10 family phage protein
MRTIAVKSGKAAKIEGVPQLINTLKDIAATMNGEGADAMTAMLKEAIMKPAMVIRDEAKDLCPVVTGKLRDSLFAAPIKSKIGAIVGTKGVYYAQWVEKGTVKTNAHPYFRPAMNATRPLFTNMIAGDLNKVIDAVAKNDAWHAGSSGG